MRPMRQFDHDVHNGIANLLNDHVEQQGCIATSKGLLKLTEVFTSNDLGWPGIIIKFVDEKGEEIWYNLELKDNEGPLQYTNSAQIPEEPVPEEDDEDDRCDVCGGDMGDWQLWYRVEHQTNDDAPNNAFCSPECTKKWLASHPDYAYSECCCDKDGREGCDCYA